MQTGLCIKTHQKATGGFSNSVVWWWGSFKSVTGTQELGELYSYSPQIMVKNARYTTCGSDFAAAIDKDDNLWTWGNNVWGQCGILTDQDYIFEPVNVLNGVTMAWTECPTTRQNNENIKYENGANPYIDIIYLNTLFVRMRNNEYYAYGIDLGNNKKKCGLLWRCTYGRQH